MVYGSTPDTSLARRVEQLEALVQTLAPRIQHRQQRDDQALQPYRVRLAETWSDSEGSYPTGSPNVYEVRFLDVDAPATVGEQTLTYRERQGDTRLIKAFDARRTRELIPRQTVVFVVQVPVYSATDCRYAIIAVPPITSEDTDVIWCKPKSSSTADMWSRGELVYPDIRNDDKDDDSYYTDRRRFEAFSGESVFDHADAFNAGAGTNKEWWPRSYVRRCGIALEDAVVGEYTKVAMSGTVPALVLSSGSNLEGADDWGLYVWPSENASGLSVGLTYSRYLTLSQASWMTPSNHLLQLPDRGTVAIDKGWWFAATPRAEGVESGGFIVGSDPPRGWAWVKLRNVETAQVSGAQNELYFVIPASSSTWAAGDIIRFTGNTKDKRQGSAIALLDLPDAEAGWDPDDHTLLVAIEKSRAGDYTQAVAFGEVPINRYWDDVSFPSWDSGVWSRYLFVDLVNRKGAAASNRRRLEVQHDTSTLRYCLSPFGVRTNRQGGPAERGDAWLQGDAIGDAGTGGARATHILPDYVPYDLHLHFEDETTDTQLAAGGTEIWTEADEVTQWMHTVFSSAASGYFGVASGTSFRCMYWIEVDVQITKDNSGNEAWGDFYLDESATGNRSYHPVYIPAARTSTVNVTLRMHGHRKLQSSGGTTAFGQFTTGIANGSNLGNISRVARRITFWIYDISPRDADPA